MRGLQADQQAGQHWLPLQLEGPQHWSFVGGAWQQQEQGIVTHGTEPADDHLAFYIGRMYSDAEVELEFCHNQAFGGAGLILRAQDASHYYLVHFPCIGQQQRAKHFWAAISKVNGTAWVEVLGMQIVPGVASETGIWHKARATIQGNQLRLWVDGRPVQVVQDNDYQSGYVGLEGWGNTTFRNVRIRGQEVPPEPWDKALQPPQNWFHPYPHPPAGVWQHALMSMTRAPNADLLMLFKVGDTPGISRSTDNGRTWSPLEEVPQDLGHGVIHTTADGRLILQIIRENEVLMAHSQDNGKTWSQPEQVECGPFPQTLSELRPWSPSPLVELADGTLVRFLLGGHPSSGDNVYEWGSSHCVAYSIRSTDGGRTWSAPVTLDGPPGAGLNLDLTEPVAAQTLDGRVLCLIRPIYSPWVWETWSDDSAASWGPTTRGAVPSYASSLLCTSSGTLLLAGRMPGLGLHVSHDNGATWQTHRIDSGHLIWACGTMYEVKPDLVLYVYMTGGRLRGQFIRVTAEGIEPTR